FVVEELSSQNTFVPIKTVGANVTNSATTTITGLQPATSYTFRVHAYNVAGNSANSGTASATTSASSGSLDFSAGFANAASQLTLNGTGAAINGAKLQITNL